MPLLLGHQRSNNHQSWPPIPCSTAGGRGSRGGGTSSTRYRTGLSQEYRRLSSCRPLLRRMSDHKTNSMLITSINANSNSSTTSKARAARTLPKVILHRILPKPLLIQVGECQVNSMLSVLICLSSKKQQYQCRHGTRPHNLHHVSSKAVTRLPKYGSNSGQLDQHLSLASLSNCISMNPFWCMKPCVTETKFWLG
jgi:hypothetical protein